MKTKSKARSFFILLIGIFAMLLIFNSCKKENEENATDFKYEAIQYTIDQPDGTTIILQSRGTGNGTRKAFFDIYIEDTSGNVTAFRNDIWYTFNGISAENALALAGNNDLVSGHIASIDSSYFLDINGGSDMGGSTFQFHTGSLQTMKSFLVQTAQPDTIQIETETGGNIDTGKPEQWDDLYENSNGAIFWNGTKFISDETAAHKYFTNLHTGARLRVHIISEVPCSPGSYNNITGYTITKTVFTYSVPKDTNGGIADLGISFPVKFNIQFNDNSGKLQEIRFIPAIVSETN